MAHKEQMEFVRTAFAWLRHLYGQDNARELTIVEVGSLDINGSVRDMFPGPKWIGVDNIPGKGVDLVGLFHELTIPPADIVVCCEVFEHDPYIGSTIDAICRVLKPGGHIVATWASPTRAEHGTPGTDGSTYSPRPNYYWAPTLAVVVALFDGRVAVKLAAWPPHGHDIYMIGQRSKPIIQSHP